MKKLLAIALLGIGSMAGQINIGIHIGPPPQPRIMRIRPIAPGAGYMWVDGYWYANSNRYAWHNGYWTRPPYEGAAWMSPRYDGGQFYQGYWSGGNRQPYPHDHKWDKDKHNRDYDRSENGNNGRGRGRGHDR